MPKLEFSAAVVVHTSPERAFDYFADYHHVAKVLKGVPEVPLKQPEGIIVARINPETGLRENDERGAISEYFYIEFPPRQREDSLSPAGNQAPREIRNQLF